MTPYTVTRAHVKKACDDRHWDLLDKLLELDSTHLNDNALYTDTWGEWWGMLLECVLKDQREGVRVLLAHGADRDLASWGDGIPLTPLEAAQDKPHILQLLNSTGKITNRRQTEPTLPTQETAQDALVNRQGTIRDETGMVFPINDQKN